MQIIFGPVALSNGATGHFLWRAMVVISSERKSDQRALALCFFFTDLIYSTFHQSNRDAQTSPDLDRGDIAPTRGFIRSIATDLVVNSARFRDAHRFPVLTHLRLTSSISACEGGALPPLCPAERGGMAATLETMEPYMVQSRLMYHSPISGARTTCGPNESLVLGGPAHNGMGRARCGKERSRITFS